MIGRYLQIPLPLFMSTLVHPDTMNIPDCFFNVVFVSITFLVLFYHIFPGHFFIVFIAGSISTKPRKKNVIKNSLNEIFHLK